MVARGDLSIVELVDGLVTFAGGRVDFALRPGADPALLDSAEKQLGYALPADVRDLYLLHDGQDASGSNFFFGYPFNPLAEAVGNWEIKRTLDASQARKFPIASWQGADELIVDMDPAPGGSVGQVTLGGYDNDPPELPYAPSLREFLARMLELVDLGETSVYDSGEGPQWGIGPSASSNLIAGDWFATPSELRDYPTWVDGLDEGWTRYFRGGGPGFTGLFIQSPRVIVPVGVQSLSALQHVTSLVSADLRNYPLDSLGEIPSAPDLYALTLGRVRSLDGAGNFPRLAKIDIRDSAGVDLSPLATAGFLTFLHLQHPPKSIAPIADIPALRSLSVVIRRQSDADLYASVVRRPGFTLQGILAPGVGSSDLDLSGLGAWRLSEFRATGGFYTD